jgi:hypothetical protein
LKSRIVHLISDIPKYGLDRNDVGVIRDTTGDSSEVFFLKIKNSFVIRHGDLREVDPTKYGDAHPEKICNVCHRILPTSQFDPNQNGKGDRQVRRPSCKDCRKTIDGVSILAAEKRKWMATKPEHVDFECPICKKITIAGLTSKVVLNHDHATGRVLGWICDSCNTGLGRFKDDIQVLNEAIEYLKTH